MGDLLADEFSNSSSSVSEGESESRRKIYLSCSGAGGLPRSYHGRDIFYWTSSLQSLWTTKEMLAKKLPTGQAEAKRYQGVKPILGPNKALSPFSVERKGVILTGKLKDVVSKIDGNSNNTKNTVELRFHDDRCKNLVHAKNSHTKIIEMVREYASKLEDQSSMDPEVPEPEWEIDDDQKIDLLTDNPGLLSLDVEAAGITNILWACGWSTDLTYLKIDQNPTTNNDFDDRTKLPDKIVSEKYPGLFFAGFPWVGTESSINIYGFDYDANIIVENLRK